MLFFFFLCAADNKIVKSLLKYLSSLAEIDFKIFVRKTKFPFR